MPRSLEPDLRDDVIGELSLMICSGEVAIDDDLQAAWKRCRSQLTRNQWKEWSLDAVIPGTDNLRGIDLLEDTVERF